jgi:hypothetical protein
MTDFAPTNVQYGNHNVTGMSIRDTTGAFSDSHESGIIDHPDDNRAESPSTRGYQNGSHRLTPAIPHQQYADYGQPTAAGPPAIRSQQQQQQHQQQMISGSSSVGGAMQNVGGMVRKKLANFVGFANLPDQVHRRSVR